MRHIGAIAGSLRLKETRRVARTYAGILALVGLLVVLVRALKDGAGFDGTILQAIAMMAVLGVVGVVVGMIAQTTVDESTKNRLQAELDAIADTEQSQLNS